MLQKQEKFGPIFLHQKINKCLNPAYTLKDLPFGSEETESRIEKLFIDKKIIEIADNLCFWIFPPLIVYFFNFLMTPLKNGCRFSNCVCAIKFVLPQAIFVPSFISIACSNQKLGRGKNVYAVDRQVIGLSPNNSILMQ